MAFHVKNPETDALARRVAKLKNLGLTETIHQALEHELAREHANPSLVELSLQFAENLRSRANPERGKPVDKPFIDSLYGDQ